jgi:hypothetical protein
MFYIPQFINAMVDSFNSIMAKDGIVLNIGRLDGLDSLPTYLKKWRMKLWNLAFLVVFKGVTPFKKSDYLGVTLLVKRVICRLA